MTTFKVMKSDEHWVISLREAADGCRDELSKWIHNAVSIVPGKQHGFRDHCQITPAVIVWARYPEKAFKGQSDLLPPLRSLSKLARALRELRIIETEKALFDLLGVDVRQDLSKFGNAPRLEDKTYRLRADAVVARLRACLRGVDCDLEERTKLVRRAEQFVAEVENSLEVCEQG